MKSRNAIGLSLICHVLFLGAANLYFSQSSPAVLNSASVDVELAAAPGVSSASQPQSRPSMPVSDPQPPINTLNDQDAAPVQQKIQPPQPAAPVQKESPKDTPKTQQHTAGGESKGPHVSETPHPGSNNSQLNTSAQPNYKNNPTPPYPESAKARGQQGTVILSLTINEEGLPTAVSIKKSSGVLALDQAAAKAAKKWTFSPAKRFGIAVSSVIEIPVTFVLNES